MVVSERQLATLNSLGLQHHPIVRDGNCQFRASQRSLGFGENDPSFMRFIAVHHIRSHPERFQNFVRRPFNEYIEMMRRDGEWGDHLTLQAIASALYVTIGVIGVDGIVTTIMPYAGETGDTIYVLYNENHYDATEPRQDEAFGPIQKRPRPLRWEGSAIREEISEGKEFYGRILLEYKHHWVDESRDHVFFKRTLKSLEKSIREIKKSQLKKFYALRWDPFSIIVDVRINYAFDAKKAEKEKQPNRRARLKDQFDLTDKNGTRQRPHVFKLQGFPHPDAVEWHVDTKEPLESKEPYDRRSTRTRRRQEEHRSPAAQKRPRQEEHRLLAQVEEIADDDAPEKCPICGAELPLDYVRIADPHAIPDSQHSVPPPSGNLDLKGDSSSPEEHASIPFRIEALSLNSDVDHNTLIHHNSASPTADSPCSGSISDGQPGEPPPPSSPLPATSENSSMDLSETGFIGPPSDEASLSQTDTFLPDLDAVIDEEFRRTDFDDWPSFESFYNDLRP